MKDLLRMGRNRLIRARYAVRDALKRPPRLYSHTDLLNHLIHMRGYRRYLEIGVFDPLVNFDRIRARDKTSVDPDPRGPVNYRGTSDEFFAALDHEGGERFDLIFIDGSHLEDQVLRDVENSLRWLADGGTIVMHDCNPSSEANAAEEFDGFSDWNGTVWKAWARLRSTRPDLAMVVVDIDHGCGVIERGIQELFPLLPADPDYRYLAANRVELLNLLPPDRFIA